ncbi:MAG: TrkA family potassium uptake protein [Candidatus Cloacimonetes bacterium]|nr:TrkA family potassium uptake protein [Candidatus Cloacimonadota bacterium]
MARYAVIGLGRFGTTVANILFDSGMEVIAIEKKQELVDEISSRVSSAICMDATDEAALRLLNLNEADAVILAIGSNIQESILTAAILRKIGVGIIYAKVENRLHGRILELIGVQHILLPEEIVGTQLAKTLISKNVREYISLSSGHVVMEMLAPRSYIGKELQELALPSEKGVNIIAIKSDSFSVTEDGRNVVEKKVNDMPGASDIVNEGDVLIMMGPQAKVDRLIHELTQK